MTTATPFLTLVFYWQSLQKLQRASLKWSSVWRKTQEYRSRD